MHPLQRPREELAGLVNRFRGGPAELQGYLLHLPRPSEILLNHYFPYHPRDPLGHQDLHHFLHRFLVAQEVRVVPSRAVPVEPQEVRAVPVEPPVV